MRLVRSIPGRSRRSTPRRSAISIAVTREAASAAYKSNLANPAHSITWVQLAASLAALGRMEEARAAAACVLKLQPDLPNQPDNSLE